MFNTLIYLFVINIINFCFEYNFLLKILTLDSLFNAIHFIKIYINSNLSESQIIVHTNNLYSGSLLDRYIYYLGIYLIYKIVCIFMWTSNIYWLYYLFMLSIAPGIINKIFDSNVFLRIRLIKEQFIKIIISKIFTYIIKFYSKLYLNKDVNIKYHEIIILFEDYRDTVNYFQNVLKNILIILGLSYVKSYSTKMYYGIIKYIYNYKTGDMLISFNGLSAKQCLINIIDNKKWHELSKPNAYKAILYLYQINNAKSDLIKNLITKFNISLIKMFTTWTLAALFSNIYIVSILSIGMLFYKRFIKKTDCENFLFELLINISSFFVGYFYNSYLLVGALCHFGAKIIFNKVTHIITKVLIKSIRKKILKIVKNNSELAISYVIIISYILILKYLNIQQNYLIIGLNIFAYVLMNIEIRKQIIFAVMLLIGNLSDFNPFHIIFNLFVLYLLFGVLEPENIINIQDNFIVNITNCFYFLKIQKKELLNTKIFANIFRLRMYFRQLISNIFNIIFRRNKKYNELVFTLMDMDKFPSIDSSNNTINTINLISKDEDINKLNEQVILYKKDFEDSVSYDDEIFNMSDKNFIEAISIEDKDFYTRKNIDQYKIYTNYYS